MSTIPILWALVLLLFASGNENPSENQCSRNVRHQTGKIET
jgi:hypothetical protein